LQPGGVWGVLNVAHKVLYEDNLIILPLHYHIQYNVHFLLVTIELSSLDVMAEALRAEIDRKSAFSRE